MCNVPPYIIDKNAGLSFALYILVFNDGIIMV